MLGEGYVPVGPVLLGSRQYADESIAAPKGRGLRTPGIFACKPQTSWGPLKGAVMPMVDPSARHPPRLGRAGPGPDGGRESCPRWAVLVAAAKKEADEPMAAPKGRESWTPGGSSLQISRFLRVRNGNYDVARGPPGHRPPETRMEDHARQIARCASIGKHSAPCSMNGSRARSTSLTSFS
jgi:hypothetical protein